MKYWNPRRIARERERAKQKQERIRESLKKEREAKRRYTPGKSARNARLMLDALGNVARRHMLMRLHQEGELSLSVLVAPLDITLPSALQHLDMLERANLVTTRKEGRLRVCTYNPAAGEELCRFLHSPKWQLEE